MEWQEFETFLTLCEELHFARTAKRMRISPARVTQLIQRLERQVGAPLFVRSSRQVTITELGAQLRADLAPAHQAILDGLQRASDTVRGAGADLRLGFLGPESGRILSELMDEFNAAHPGAQARMVVETQFHDPFGPLRDGQIDVLAVSLPVREPGLTVGPVIIREGQVLVLPTDHPLAGLESASVEVLADYPVQSATGPDYWVEHYTPERTPSGRPVQIVGRTETITAGYTLVASGKGMGVLIAQQANYHRRPDIAYVPLHDAPVAEVALVWRTSDESNAIRTIARLAAARPVAEIEARRFNPAERSLPKPSLSQAVRGLDHGGDGRRFARPD